MILTVILLKVSKDVLCTTLKRLSIVPNTLDISCTYKYLSIRGTVKNRMLQGHSFTMSVHHIMHSGILTVHVDTLAANCSARFRAPTVHSVKPAAILTVRSSILDVHTIAVVVH